MNNYLKLLRYPIIQAPLSGGTTNPKMVIEVCKTGCMGSHGCAYLTLDQLRSDCREIINGVKDLNVPFNLNLFAPSLPSTYLPGTEYWNSTLERQLTRMNDFLNVTFRTPLGLEHRKLDSFNFPNDNKRFQDQCNVILEECGKADFNQIPKVFSFTFGSVDRPTLDRFADARFMLVGSATNVEEAKLLADQCRGRLDAIVLQGKEAGGHRGAFIDASHANSTNLLPSLDLLRECKKNIADMPLIVAGGIRTQSDIKQMISNGASAVQIGSAFIGCDESTSNQYYKKIVLNSDGISSNNQPIIYTNYFTGRYARAIKNKFIDIMESEFKENEIPPFPMQHILTTDIRKKALEKGQLEYAHLWIGESASLSSKATSVKSVIDDLTK